MPINDNWTTWIFASVCKHFDSHSNDLYLHIDGTARKTGDHANVIELRLNGPIMRELSKNYYQIDAEVNLLIQTAVKHANIYQHRRNLGIAEAACTRYIYLYQIGSESGATGNMFGCLTLVNTPRNNGIETKDYGIVRPQVDLQQATVEATYRTYLEGD